MGNYEQLKNAVEQVIKENGNEEITGVVLQNILKTIISNIGENATFRGVANKNTNPTTTDANVFYLAYEPGTYTGFNLDLTGNEVFVLENKTGVWTAKSIGNASVLLAQKINSQSAGVFLGVPIVNFTEKTVSFPNGYYSDGETAYNIAGQNLSWTGQSALNVVLNKKTKIWSLKYVADTIKPNIDEIIVGLIDVQRNKMYGKFSNIDPGKMYNPMGNIGYLFGIGFQIKLDIGNIKNPATTNWSFTTIGTGRMLTNSGETLISVAPQTITGNDVNLRYVYIDKGTGLFIIYPYNEKPERSFLNLYFIGIFNPNDGTAILNASNVVINDVLKKDFTQNDYDKLNSISNAFGEPINETLPTENWMSKSWNSELTPGLLYLDKQCKFDKTKPIKRVNINANKAGNIEVHLLDMQYNTLYVWTKNCVVGLNSIDITGISYTQPYYIAIKGVSPGALKTIFPNTGNQFGFRVNTDVTPRTATQINYEMAYTIDVVDYSPTLTGRVEILEQAIGVNISDDINELLNSNDVVTLEPKDYFISSPIIMQSGKVLKGSFGKTRLILTNGCKKAITGSDLTNIKISDLEIVGTEVNYKYQMNGIIEDATYQTVVTEQQALDFDFMGDEIGIELIRCEKVILNDLIIRNIKGSAFKINRVGRDYIWGLKANNIFISNCYNGIYAENEHEFSEWTNFSVTLCMIGIYFDSGNLIFTAGHITRCRVGMMLKDGYNHAHGICNGIEIKHNQIAGILINGIQHGQFFQGMYISYCNLIIRNSRGINFDSMTMSAGTIICSGNFPEPTDPTKLGKNYIVTLFERAPGSISINNTGNLEIINKYEMVK